MCECGDDEIERKRGVCVPVGVAGRALCAPDDSADPEGFAGRNLLLPFAGPSKLPRVIAFSDSPIPWIRGIGGREGDLPEVYRCVHELDSHGPFAFLHGAHIHNPAFLLFSGLSVHN